MIFCFSRRFDVYARRSGEGRVEQEASFKKLAWGKRKGGVRLPT